MTIKDPNGRLARWAIFLQAFDFDIEHRSGIKHSNVDALSRPVIDGLQLVIVDEEHSSRSDIYNDQHLHTFVTTGLHPSGSSSKQVKRVLKQASHYKMYKEDIYYRRNNKTTIWLLVPNITDRADIILRAHSLGHFNANSTYNRIKDQYYWYNMLDNIKSVVNNCKRANVNN